MSAFAQRSNETPAHEYEWLDFSDRAEMSVASIWALEDDDETTIQTRRPAKSAEQVATAMSGESDLEKIGPQIRKLDESQILPGEASFATVVLNHEIQPTGCRPSEQEAPTGFEQSNEPKGDSRKRVLDESDVLPGEVSFATVMRNERNAARTYSPIEEFHAKFKLNWKTLSMAAVILFSLSASVTLAILKIAEAVRSRPTVITPDRVSAPKAEPASPTQATASDSARSVVSPKQKQATPPVISSHLSAPQPEKRRDEISSNRLPNPAVTEDSRKTASEVGNKKVESKVSRQDAKSAVRGATTAGSKRTVAEKPRQKDARDRVDRKNASKKQVKVNKAPSGAVTRNQSASVSKASAARPEAEPSKAPSSTGAQRPRTVTRKDP